MPRPARPAVLLTLALAAIGSGTAATAVAQDDLGLRAIGGDTFSLKTSTLSSFATFCVNSSNATVKGCVPEASGSIKVDAATRSKYKLASSTIATGTETVPCGEVHCLKMLSTKTVRSKLKNATRLPVTITFKAESPAAETMKKQVVLRLKISDRVIFQTANAGAAPSGRG